MKFLKEIDQVKTVVQDKSFVLSWNETHFSRFGNKGVEINKNKISPLSSIKEENLLKKYSSQDAAPCIFTSQPVHPCTKKKKKPPC